MPTDRESTAWPVLVPLVALLLPLVVVSNLDAEPKAPDPATAAAPLIHDAGPFVYAFDPATGTARWSAIWIPAGSLEGPTERLKHFRTDPGLPACFRHSDAAYRNSPFQRGHLTADADTGTQAAAAATYTTANIVPQYPAANRGPIAAVEAAARAYSQRRPAAPGRGVLVVTVQIFDGPPAYLGPFAIPAAIGKAALIFDDGRPVNAAAWIVPNTIAAAGPADAFAVGLAELETRAQIDLYPNQNFAEFGRNP